MAEEDKKVDRIKTYIETALEHIAKDPNFYSEEQQKGMLAYAKYLDSFQGLSTPLYILVMQQTMKIDRELIQECIHKFGKAAVTELAAIVNARHKRKIVPTPYFPAEEKNP